MTVYFVEVLEGLPKMDLNADVHLIEDVLDK